MNESRYYIILVYTGVIRIMNEEELNNYYLSLSPKEQHAFHIAKEHLGSLFDITKTNGFLQWKQGQTKKAT